MNMRCLSLPGNEVLWFLSPKPVLKIVLSLSSAFCLLLLIGTVFKQDL